MISCAAKSYAMKDLAVLSSKVVATTDSFEADQQYIYIYIYNKQDRKSSQDSKICAKIAIGPAGSGFLNPTAFPAHLQIYIVLYKYI